MPDELILREKALEAIRSGKPPTAKPDRARLAGREATLSTRVASRLGNSTGPRGGTGAAWRLSI